jgi:hypothetical protein
MLPAKELPMKNLKPVLWIAVGIVVGAAGVLTASQGGVLRQDPTATVGRLQVTKVGAALQNDAFFIKDPQSGACWLALKWQADSVNLAVAPKEACD